MVMRTKDTVKYSIAGPYMNRAVPPNRIAPGSFGELVGVDGRYDGCLRKFYGMTEVVDLDATQAAIDTYDGPSFIQHVTFHKKGTADTIRGFVVRWDEGNDNTNEAVDLYYTTDGSAWAEHAIVAQSGSGITSSTAMDCVVDGDYLFVAIEGVATKVVYWTGSAYTTKDAGPGAFSATLEALTSSSTAVSSTFELRGDGVYQVAWRFYDSTRGIYSALSDPLTVTLDHLKTTKATGSINMNYLGGDSGLLQAGDVVQIGGVSYGVPGPGLHLPFNGTAGGSITDSSATGHTINKNGTAAIVDYVGERSAWGTGALSLDGDSDYLDVDDHADWDVVGSNTDNWTIDLWVKHTDHVGTEMYVCQVEGADDYWYLYHVHGSGIRFYVNSGASGIIDTGFGGEITDTNWHHVALCKVAANYGIYLDGTQVAHTNDSDTDTFAGSLYVGATSTPANFFAGNMDDIRITPVNAFDAAPVSGLTDTFTVPSGQHNYGVTLDGLTTITQYAVELARVINDDSNSVVAASSVGSGVVMLECVSRGSGGNTYTLTEAEAGSNTDDIAVSGPTLGGGGVATEEPEEHCKATLDFPAHGSVVATLDYDDFAALFDTVDVFRTINLGTGATSTQGAIFYLEQTIGKATPNWSNSTEWDALQVTIGTKVDEALPFQTMYNPETDIVAAPPTSGTIGRYQDTTFMVQTLNPSSGTNLDTIHSSIEHGAADYFTTFNKRSGRYEEGRPLRYMIAGDSMYILCPNAVVHVYKSSKYRPLQFVVLHQNRGLAGKYAAHTVGNSIIMMGKTGVMMLNGSDGTMSGISAANRLVRDDWANDLSTLNSGYDSLLDCSFFLHPGDMEVLQIYHGSQSANVLEGADFKLMTSGPDVTTTNGDVRAYFITDTGRIVTPDVDQSGSGTMWGHTGTLTLNGTVTTIVTPDKTSVLDTSNANMNNADFIGCLLYMTTGDNAGVAREITAVAANDITVAAFANNIAAGDQYAISPVPFKVRLWPLRDPDPRGAAEAFSRWIMRAVGIKVRKLVGLTSNDNVSWRIGVYRNSDSSIESGTNATVTLALNANPADSVAALDMDGIDVEPYIEFISSGTSFELTDAEIYVTLRGSKEVTA